MDGGEASALRLHVGFEREREREARERRRPRLLAGECNFLLRIKLANMTEKQTKKNRSSERKTRKENKGIFVNAVHISFFKIVH